MAAIMDAKAVRNDDDYEYLIDSTTKWVCVVFIDDDSPLEADIPSLAKSPAHKDKKKDVTFMLVKPRSCKNVSKDLEIEDHELPTFVFYENGDYLDKLATGMSYEQLNGCGVTTEKLETLVAIMFKWESDLGTWTN